jgi:hypothetical protein
MRRVGGLLHWLKKPIGKAIRALELKFGYCRSCKMEVEDHRLALPRVSRRNPELKLTTPMTSTHGSVATCRVCKGHTHIQQGNMHASAERLPMGPITETQKRPIVMNVILAKSDVMLRLML